MRLKEVLNVTKVCNNRWYVTSLEINTDKYSNILCYWQEFEEDYKHNFEFSLVKKGRNIKIRENSIYISPEIADFDILGKILEKSNVF